ncbi:MAG TPA: bifunctional phosphoglucose/phosphomannose isomerase [Candidatus Anoxymicrobiaceae bacterium]
MAAKQNTSDGPSREVDSSGMLKVLENFPGQVAEAIEIGQSELALPSSEGLSSVVVLGMGGSGISGDVVAALSADAGLKLPVVTCKGYELPGFVGPDTLVFAVSYSGNTEETLDTMGQAMERGARMVAVSAGGKVTQIAESNSIPVFRIPSGLQPRAALGYLAVPIMSALDRMGMVAGTVARFRAALPMLEARLQEYGPGATGDDNGPMRLARELMDFVPIVYGMEGYLAVAASRWKAQFNEMAKVPSFHNYFPELNHNETVGWENLPDVCRRCHVIVLGEPALHARIEKRVKITIELIQESVGGVTRICARGSNTVERLLDLIYFGDFASVYLALATGQDPTPIARIDEFKKRMAG